MAAVTRSRTRLCGLQATPATVNQAFDRNNRVSPREAIMDPQISLQEVVRYEADNSERPSGILVSFKSHKHRLQQSPAVSQGILVIFTSGLFACVVGVASLIEPARISDHLSFRIFYPSGTILMLSILLLKFPPNLIPASVAWIKFVLQLSLMLAPVLMMTFVRLIFYGDPILTVLAAGAVFSGQLVVSFTYVLLCMRDMRY